jgi:ABC-2 type transport system permease protein
MPVPVRWFAENQPVTSIVDSIRSLFAGVSANAVICIALAWCVGIFVLAYVGAIYAYRRRTA